MQLAVATAAALALTACGGSRPAPAPWSEAWLARARDGYLDAPAQRRATLEASLVNPTNLYSRQRLKAYGLATAGWDALPEWNPRSRPIDRAIADDLRRGVWPAPAARLWDGVRPRDRAGWIALGRRVFFEYPLRPEFAAEHALLDAGAGDGATLGLTRGPDGALPGLVVFDDVDGRQRIGITCAICHTAIAGGAIVEGRARRDFDLGRLRLDYYRDTGAPVDAELARRMATWGPGRADVTEDDDEDPVAIPDLWGLRAQGFLTQAGTIRQVGPAALAIRQETQFTHASGLRVRPPRELAWALAMYLYALEPPPARAPGEAAVVARGAAIFDAECRRCHASAIGGGDPIAVGAVGTDPALADGKARGTGRYRIAPLVRVADAAPYLHDGSVPTLDALLGRARLAPDYTGGARGPGPIRGHAFGLELDDDARAALIAYLDTL